MNNDIFEQLRLNFLPRFWDIKNKVMIYPEFDKSFECIIYYHSLWKYTLGDCVTNKNLIMMKPIGLKDKKGNLIYGGDLIKPYFDECGYAEIRWNNSKASFGIWIKSWYLEDGEGGYGSVEANYEGWDKDIDISDFENGGFEIIGNIYSNPELRSV